jgi:hypothetical protein
MALRLVPQSHSVQAFRIEAETGLVAIAYRDAVSRQWLLTPDANHVDEAGALPDPFQRWTYEFAALPELCAFLSAPEPGAQDLRDAA